MYPTIVIVLAETQLSMSDICEIRVPNASRLVSKARAASAVDNEAESPRRPPVRCGTKMCRDVA